MIQEMIEDGDPVEEVKVNTQMFNIVNCVLNIK